MDERDVVVIGGGPAGFMAAQRIVMLGRKATVVERERVGGICPNWGCIPMCFMDHCIEVLRSAKEAHKDGINVGEVKIDYSRLIKEKDRVVSGLVSGMEARLQAVGVEVIIGAGKLASPNGVEITLNDGKKRSLRARNIILAAGSVARRYPVPGAYGADVLTPRELLDLRELPKSLTIIGRGVAALELATVWANLGSKVSLIARKPQLLPNEDEELTQLIQPSLDADGVQVYGGVDIEKIEDSARGKSVTISNNGKKQTVESQFVVFALGQQPNVEDLGLENAGIAFGESGIKTNEMMETSARGIYAAGDITGEAMLASVAMRQGTIATDNAAGRKSAIDYRVIPHFIRTIPPIASVGITEGEARAKGLNIKVGRCPFEINPKANILRESRGMVKIIAEAATGEILGVHIIGAQATELIHEPAAIMKMKGTVRDIGSIIHGHPCLLETLQRAAQSLCS